MKKIIYFVICAFVFALNTSCTEDKVVYNVNNPSAVVSFDMAGEDFKLDSTDPTTYTKLIQVDVTTISSVDRAFTIEAIIPPGGIDISSYYTIDPTSLIIPAGTYNGFIKVSGNYDNIATGAGKLVEFKLTSIEGGTVATGTINKYDLKILKV